METPSSLVAIGNHGFYPVYVRAEGTQLDLLALACLDRERICVHPLVSGHVRRVVRVGQYIEDSRIINDREERHRGHDLLQYIPNLGLDLRLWLGRWPV